MSVASEAQIRAAVALAGLLRERPDTVAETLAGFDAPTSAAALGTSVKQAGAVAAALRATNWALLPVDDAGDAEGAEGERIAARLREALELDELAVALVPRLHDAEVAATALLKRIAARSVEAPPPSVSPPPSAVVPAVEAVSPVVVPVRQVALPAVVAVALDALREQVRREHHLDITWTVTEITE